jgi:hypothetical protein
LSGKHYCPRKHYRGVSTDAGKDKAIVGSADLVLIAFYSKINWIVWVDNANNDLDESCSVKINIIIFVHNGERISRDHAIKLKERVSRRNNRASTFCS